MIFPDVCTDSSYEYSYVVGKCMQLLHAYTYIIQLVFMCSGVCTGSSGV